MRVSLYPSCLRFFILAVVASSSGISPCSVVVLTVLAALGTLGSILYLFRESVIHHASLVASDVAARTLETEKLRHTTQEVRLRPSCSWVYSKEVQRSVHNLVSLSLMTLSTVRNSMNPWT